MWLHVSGCANSIAQTQTLKQICRSFLTDWLLIEQKISGKTIAFTHCSQPSVFSHISLNIIQVYVTSRSLATSITITCCECYRKYTSRAGKIHEITKGLPRCTSTYILFLQWYEERCKIVLDSFNCVSIILYVKEFNSDALDGVNVASLEVVHWFLFTLW